MDKLTLVAAVVGAVVAVRKLWPQIDGPKVLLVVVAAAALVAYSTLEVWPGTFVFGKTVAGLVLAAVASYELANRVGGAKTEPKDTPS